MAVALAAPPAWAPTGCAIRPPLAHRRAVLAGRSHAVSRTAAAAASPLAGRHEPHATPSWGTTRRRSGSGRGGPAPLRQTGGGVLEAAEAGSPGSGGHSTRWFERSADALLDDLGAADTITSLLHTCMTERGIDDADNSHPFTVFLIFHVPTNRTLQFETWVQKTISLQAQRFPGYRGTLIYRPDSNIKVRGGKAGDSAGSHCLRNTPRTPADFLPGQVSSCRRFSELHFHCSRASLFTLLAELWVFSRRADVPFRASLRRRWAPT